MSNETNNNKNIGGLYRLKTSIEINENDPPRFCFIVDDKIVNEASWNDRFHVNHETLPLMLVKNDTDLMISESLPTAPWAEALASARTTAASAAVSTAADSRAKVYDYDLARKQIRENMCVAGSAFLTPDGKNIWISDIDFKYFEKVEL